MLNPEARKVRARLAAHRRWCRKRTCFFLRILGLCTLALPPVVVLALPAEAQVIVVDYLTTVPLSLAIAWRVHDSRKRD